MTPTAQSAQAFPPGEYLRDELDARGWTISEFAEILGRPVQAVSEIINGRKMISATTAKEIGGALGTTPEVWLNLQNAYLLRTEGPGTSALSDIARKAKLRGRVPLAEIRRLGWIPAAASLDETEQSVRGLLDVKSLDEPTQLALAARRKNTHDPLSPSQEAWLGRVRQLGLAMRTAPFDHNAASQLAAQLSTRLLDPSAIKRVPAWLAEVGIAVVFLPALKGSKIDGVALRPSADQIVIGLSGRGNRFDTTVFTLAHEMAHVLLGHLESSGSAVLDEDLRSATNAIEKAANRQATLWLFPAGIPIEPPFGRPNVERVAAALGCHPSLVVGNLQWNGQLDWGRLGRLLPKLSDLLPEFSKSRI